MYIFNWIFITNQEAFCRIRLNAKVNRNYVYNCYINYIPGQDVFNIILKFNKLGKTIQEWQKKLNVNIFLNQNASI